MSSVTTTRNFGTQLRIRSHPLGTCPSRRHALPENLIKPETEGQHFVQVDSARKNVHALSKFDVIGFTEKEIGNSVLERMQNLANIRLVLNKAA